MQFVPHSNIFSITKTHQLKWFKDIIDIYTENHLKNMNTIGSQIQSFLMAR
jgi:hypothetical protein